MLACPAMPRSKLSLGSTSLLAFALALSVGSCGGNAGDDASTSAQGTPPANPPASTPSAGDSASATAIDGAAIFASRCALCHGPSGHGDGTAAKALNPKPRNFRDAAYMSSRTDEQLLEVIRNGKGAMPAWGKSGTLTEAQMREVLRHVRSFAGQP